MDCFPGIQQKWAPVPNGEEVMNYPLMNEYWDLLGLDLIYTGEQFQGQWIVNILWDGILCMQCTCASSGKAMQVVLSVDHGKELVKGKWMWCRMDGFIMPLKRLVPIQFGPYT